MKFLYFYRKLLLLIECVILAGVSFVNKNFYKMNHNFVCFEVTKPKVEKILKKNFLSQYEGLYLIFEKSNNSGSLSKQD